MQMNYRSGKQIKNPVPSQSFSTINDARNAIISRFSLNSGFDVNSLQKINGFIQNNVFIGSYYNVNNFKIQFNGFVNKYNTNPIAVYLYCLATVIDAPKQAVQFQSVSGQYQSLDQMANDLKNAINFADPNDNGAELLSIRSSFSTRYPFNLLDGNLNLPYVNAITLFEKYMRLYLNLNQINPN
jgi:hypothetical protein